MALHHLLFWTPAAVVFDCDGTLMNTECHWVEARQRVLDDVGLELPADFAERAKGLHYSACGRLMADEAGRPELGADLAARLLRHFGALVSDRPLTMPGAREMVEAAAAYGPLAVASNCPREVVEASLDTAGLLHHFRAVVVPDEKIRPKPDPDVYLAAAGHCGTDPADTLAVEDTHCGILAAVRAGMRVLGVGPWPGKDTAGLADLWVETLAAPRTGGRAAEQDRDCSAATVPRRAAVPPPGGNGTAAVAR
ncbi:HAD family phosphatase [Streptomyces ziwulingensis]|uniref:HAD family phosphatase n=1 Tax=Streptomyces ziwulingensis TaxID=1045501 RepID=A0ABP9BHQ8_9ACTN